MDEDAQRIIFAGIAVSLVMVIVFGFGYLGHKKTRAVQALCFQELKTVECWDTLQWGKK